MRDSVPSASYSSVCNVLRQWSISLIHIFESTDSMIWRHLNAFLKQHFYFKNPLWNMHSLFSILFQYYNIMVHPHMKLDQSIYDTLLTKWRDGTSWEQRMYDRDREIYSESLSENEGGRGREGEGGREVYIKS